VETWNGKGIQSGGLHRDKVSSGARLSRDRAPNASRACGAELQASGFAADMTRVGRDGFLYLVECY
jgi:hypothetical protein